LLSSSELDDPGENDPGEDDPGEDDRSEHDSSSDSLRLTGVKKLRAFSILSLLFGWEWHVAHNP
jgi:hypothetical protein